MILEFYRETRCPTLCGTVTQFHYFSRVPQIGTLSRIVIDSVNNNAGQRLNLSSVGEDIILNCSVDSNVPPNKTEEVSWRRTIQDQDIPILLFQHNEVHSDSSHESYQERAEFFISEIPKGNFSLKLKDVKIEDEGEFICEVHTGDLSAHTIVVLQRLVTSGKTMFP
ncbi:hypothetical protein MHYP_G00046130 [Metynnis hypsauchen]